MRRALAIREQALGADQPDVASSLEALGWLYASQGKPAAAEPLLKRALALYEVDLGKDHPDVARCCSKMGRVCLTEDHPVEAEACCKRAVSIYEQIGDDPLDLATALEDYAAVLSKTGRASEAEKLVARARSLRESVPKSEAPKP